MPNYYPYYSNINPYNGYGGYSSIPQPVQIPAQQMFSSSGNNYWISVDGEMAARAWQMPPNLPPNSIIPLWDLDGQHVYFKSTDAYGRINPIRKGHVVFDDEPVNLPQGQASYANGAQQSDDSKYVTREDFEGLRNEIQNMLNMQAQRNSSGNYSSQNTQTAANSTPPESNPVQSKWKKNG